MLFFSRCYLHYSFCATSPWVLTFFFALPLLPRYNFHVVLHVLHLLCLSFHVAPLALPLPRCFFHIVILALLLSCYSSHVAPFKLQHTTLFVSHYISSPTTTLLAFFQVLANLTYVVFIVLLLLLFLHCYSFHIAIFFLISQCGISPLPLPFAS